MKFAHRPKRTLAAIFTVGLVISGPSGKLALFSCLCFLLCSWASEPGVSHISINDRSAGEERRLSPFSPSPPGVRSPRIKSNQFLRDSGQLTDEIPFRKSGSASRKHEGNPERSQNSRETKFDFRSVDKAPEPSHLQSQIGFVTDTWLKEREIGSQDVARLDDLQFEIDALIDRWTKTASASPTQEYKADGIGSRPRSVRSKNSTLNVPDTPSKYLESEVHSSGVMADAAECLDQTARISATPLSQDDLPRSEIFFRQSPKATNVTGKVEKNLATERLQSEFFDSEELMSKSRRSLKQLSDILESRGLREQWVDPSPSCLYGALVQQFNDMPLLRAELEQRGYDFSSELSYVDNITTARFVFATELCKEDVMSFLSAGKDLEWRSSLSADKRHQYLEDTQAASAWSGLREVIAASRLFRVEIQLFIISEDEVIERVYRPNDQDSYRNETIRLINCGSFFWSAIPDTAAQIADYPSSHDVIVHSDPANLFAKEPSSAGNTGLSEQSCIDSSARHTVSHGSREMRDSTPQSDSRRERLRDARILGHQQQGDDHSKDAPPNITDVLVQRNIVIEEKLENSISYIDYRAAPMQFTNVSSRVFRTGSNNLTNFSGARHSFLRKGARQMKRATAETAGLALQENLDHDAADGHTNSTATGLNIIDSPRAGFLFRDQQANHSVLQYNAKLKDIPSIVSKYWTAPAEAFNLTAGNSMMRTNRVGPIKVQGQGKFKDHRGMRDSWSSGAEWAGSDDFEDSSEFRTRRPREFSTDLLGSEVEQRLMEDFFQETIKLATPKAPPRSIGKSSKLFYSSSRGRYSTPPPPPSSSWAQSSVWHTRSDVIQQGKSPGRNTGLYSNNIPHSQSTSTASGGVEARGLNTSAGLGANLAKKSQSPLSNHVRSRIEVRDSESRLAEGHGVLANAMKDLLQFVKQSEVRNAESLKLLHDRNSELTEKMVDMLNQTGPAQAKALIDERIANLERELQAQVKEANEEQARAREMHRMKDNESQGGVTAQQDIRDASSVPNTASQTKSPADHIAPMEQQAIVNEANEKQSSFQKIHRIHENESQNEIARQYRGASSVPNAATQSNFSANLERKSQADTKEADEQRSSEMHRKKENGVQSRVMAHEDTRDEFTTDAGKQIKFSADRIARLERELQEKVKEADEQLSRLREMHHSKEYASQRGVMAQQYRGSSSVLDSAAQSKISADRNSGAIKQQYAEGPLNFYPATQSRIPDEPSFNVESHIPGTSATSTKRHESSTGYTIHDPLRMGEAKAALQRQMESKLEADLENQLLESERSDSTYDRPDIPSRSPRRYRQSARSQWQDGPRGLNVHFPNSLWHNDYMGETRSIYFKEQCAAWDRRLTAEISAAIPTFEQANLDYRHDAKTRRRKEFDYSMPNAPWDENFDFRGGEKVRHADQNSRRQQLFGGQSFYRENEGRFDGNNIPSGANLELRSDPSYPFPSAVSHGSDPHFQPEFRTNFDDVTEGSSQSLKQRAEQVGQDIEEARQRVESAREALAIVVEDAARKGEHAERLKAALDEIREIREKRSEVEKRVLELQAEEEEHIQELNDQKHGGASRLDKRRTGRDGTARKELASGGGIQFSDLRSTATDGKEAAVIDDNRSAALDSLREKLTEAENFNRQLENRLRRAEEILEAARSQPLMSANTTNTAPASPSSPQENLAHAPSGVLAPAAVIGSAPTPLLPDPAAASVKASTESQPADPVKQAPWILPGHVLEREPLELRPPPQDFEWQRRADDQVLANRLAALVPLDDASASRQPRVPAAAQAWAPFPPAPPPVTFDRYNYPQGGWGPPTRTGRAEPLSRRSPPPLDRRGSENSGRARWDLSSDEMGRHQLQSGPAARRSMGRRSDRRGSDGDFDQRDEYEEEVQGRQERRERSRNRGSRRAPSRRGEGGGDRRESADRVSERRAREERRAPDGRRRREGEGRRGNDAETDAGEVERLLASVGLSGYEAVLLRNGWDCMARLRLIKEADLVGMGVKPGHARIMAESIGRALSAA